MAEPDGRITFDGDRIVEDHHCDACGHDYRSIVDFLLRDGDAWAIVRAQLHRHDGDAITYVQATFGSLWDEAATDKVTFASRIGPVEGYTGNEARLLDADGADGADASVVGERLTRERALEHALLPDFWELLDWLALHDPDIAENVSHGPAR